MDKFAKGEKVTADELEEMRRLSGQQDLLTKGFTPEQAKAAIREGLKGSPGEKQRQSDKLNALKDQIQKLMALEYQILAIPKTIESLRVERDKAKVEANKARAEARAAKTDEDKLSKRGREYNEYMKIANFNAQIIRHAYLAPVLNAQRRDMEQTIRRRLGVSGGFQAGMEWGGAKAELITTGVQVSIKEELAWTFNGY